MFLLLISIVMMSFISNFVSASSHEGGGLGDAFDTIRELFAFLPDLITLESLIGEEPAALFWAKFLVWLLLFAVVYFGAGFVFKDNKRIAVVVALVIALMGTLLMPQSILINIFQTYGLIAGIIIWIIPVAAGMYIAHKVDQPFLRALIYGLAIWVLISINKTVVIEQGIGNTTFPFFSLLLVVVIILFLVNLVSMFGGQGAVDGARGWAGDKARDAWDWATGGRRGDRDDDEGDHRRERGEHRDREDRRREIKIH